MDHVSDCLLCRWSDADREFDRVEVWADDLWRVTTSLRAPVLGFSYLEPKRHIPHITDLDGAEATALGPTLARLTRILKESSGADLVYVNVFGDRVAHLHFNIAPHRVGDVLVGGAGMTRPDAAPLDRQTLSAFAVQLRRELA